MTLLEVLLSSAIAALVVLTVASVMEQVQLMQTHSDLKSTLQTLKVDIRSTLNRPVNCTQAIHVPVTGVATGVGVPTTIDLWWPTLPPALFLLGAPAAGQNLYSAKIFVSSIQFVPVGSAPSFDVGYTYVAGNLNLATAPINPGIVDKNINYNISIPLNLKLDNATNHIVSCSVTAMNAGAPVPLAGLICTPGQHLELVQPPLSDATWACQ